MREAALKAIALNPLLPEAHVALGSVLSLLDWNWAAGEQELEKSIQLDQSRSDRPCRLRHSPGVPRKIRARADRGGARPGTRSCLAVSRISFWDGSTESRRRFDEAISQHMLVSQLAPDYGLPHFGLGLAYAGKGMYDDAIAHFTNANPLKCRSLLRGQLGYCYAKAGRREEALHEIRALKERSAQLCFAGELRRDLRGIGRSGPSAPSSGARAGSSRYVLARKSAQLRFRHPPRTNRASKPSANASACNVIARTSSVA